MNWSQKLIYREGKFHLNVPFKFPAYVFPVGKAEISKREKIVLNLNSCVNGGEIACSYSSHPLKVFLFITSTKTFFFFFRLRFDSTDCVMCDR